MVKTLKNITEKRKVLTFSALFISLILIIVFIGLSIASPDSTILRDTEIEGLKITEVNLEYADGVSTYTAQITNSNDTTYNLKYINIEFKDEENNITKLVGYIGESLEKNESKQIKASIDKDLTNSNSLEYSIIK